MKQVTSAPAFSGEQKDFTFRAVFYGLLIGLVLMCVMAYLDIVLGMDTNVATIASMIGILVVPTIGGPTNRREINLMQSCATATIFAAFSVYDNITAMFMMGEELSMVPIFVLLVLTDAMGICFVSILRDQYVNDPNLPFPGAVMCATALDQIDKKDNSSTKILLIATAIGFVLSLLQNFQIVPMIVGVTKYLPISGMSLELMIVPIALGTGYVLGAKNALCMLAVSSIVCFVEGPVGTAKGWFTDPNADFYSSLQDFNLPAVVGCALFAALVPFCREWRSMLNAFRFTKKADESGRDYSVKFQLIILIALMIATIVFSYFYYGINPFHLFICTIISLLFAMIAVRVFAESGLGAGVALNLFMIVIAYLITKNAAYSMLITFMSFNTFALAQDTMTDLKIGQQVSASPKNLLKAQFIGVIVGGIAGMCLFYAIIKAFGLNDDLFTYPVANMYHSVISGVTEGGASGFFNPLRFGFGAVLGTILSFVGLPAGGIAIAMYLAPRAVMGLALGGVIRWVIEKTKGDEVAEKFNNAATGVIIGDAIVTISMVGITLASA